jgi:hypothetical protein
MCGGKSSKRSAQGPEFAQGDDNNESDDFLYLPIIDDLRQANLLSRQQWIRVGGFGWEGTGNRTEG